MYDELLALPPTRRAEMALPDSVIRSAIRRGSLLPLRRGVLVGRDVVLAATTERDRHMLLTKAAIRATRVPTYACLGSAALLHNFDRLGQTPKRVRLYRARGTPWRDSDVAVLTCGLPSSHLGKVDGVPCTSPPRTVVDLARWVTFRSGVVVADSALRQGVTRDQLDRIARACSRWPGMRKARQVIAFADRRAATPLESISRVAFAVHGLPAPELQVTLVWDEFGNPRYIVDFYWPEFAVVGEADGLMKYDDAHGSSLRAEKLRQEELEALGYIVVRWTWDDIWRRPEWVAWRLRNAMAEGARRRRTA